MILYPNMMWAKSRKQIANVDDYVIISNIIMGFKDGHDFYFVNRIHPYNDVEYYVPSNLLRGMDHWQTLKQRRRSQTL